MMSLISALGERDMERIEDAVEIMAEGYGMTDYFNSIVGVDPAAVHNTVADAVGEPRVARASKFKRR